MFDRWHVCEAYFWYDVLWGPTSYGARLCRIGYNPGVLASLERADPEVKRIYGALVREHNKLFVAFERFKRRSRSALSWPGTRNMPRGESAWLESVGLLEALSYYM